MTTLADHRVVSKRHESPHSSAQMRVMCSCGWYIVAPEAEAMAEHARHIEIEANPAPITQPVGYVGGNVAVTVTLPQRDVDLLTAEGIARTGERPTAPPPETVRYLSRELREHADLIADLSKSLKAAGVSYEILDRVGAVVAELHGIAGLVPFRHPTTSGGSK